MTLISTRYQHPLPDIEAIVGREYDANRLSEVMSEADEVGLICEKCGELIAQEGVCFNCHRVFNYLYGGGYERPT